MKRLEKCLWCNEPVKSNDLFWHMHPECKKVAADYSHYCGTEYFGVWAGGRFVRGKTYLKSIHAPTRPPIVAPVLG